MKTQTILLSGGLLLLALISSLGLSVRQWSSAEQALVRVEQQRYHAHLLAEELRHTSDDLSHFARSYAITGDERYMFAFQRVRAVRAGQHARPANFNLAYWDLVLAGFPAPSEDGQAVPLLTRLKDTGVKTEELQMLKDAEAASDSLAEIESNALLATSGTKEQRDHAIQQLHSSQYYLAKGQIMKSYNNFITTLDRRNQREIDAAQQRLWATASLIWINLGLMALTVLAGVVMLKRRLQ
jgi:methyl-accepting chemotaxis protein